LLPDEALASPQVDFLVRGEGERSFPNLVHTLENQSDPLRVKGVSFKKNGQVVHNIDEEHIQELDSIPHPARELLWDMDSYDSEALGHLFTSRGCPYKCNFCSSAGIWSRKVRYRSVESMIEEIRLVKERYGTKQFSFWDDVFTINKERTRKFCEALIKERLNVYWSCTCRFDNVNEEIIVLMKEAGCNNMEFGVESGSERILKYIKKGVDKDKMRQVAHLLNKHGVYWSAFFIIGFPTEPEEEIWGTVRFMKELKPQWATFGIFTPYPGTELFDIAVEKGLMARSPDWSRFGHQSPHNRFSDQIKPERFELLVSLVSRAFDRHNRNPYFLLKKALSRIRIYSSPRELFADGKKLLSWLGLIKAA
ncbi:MAG: B12-binding domain-containing radical SAM protein, partial [Candidatus Binatia bacterium]